MCKMVAFSYALIRKHVLGTQKNHLIEMVLLSTLNICFGREQGNKFSNIHFYHSKKAENISTSDAIPAISKIFSILYNKKNTMYM